MAPRRVYLAVGACAVVVYIGALRNAFAWDDLEIVTNNNMVHSWSGVWRAFLRPYWLGEQGGQLYRPLTIASFVVDWHVDGAIWFHALNVVWHAGASVLVAALLHRWIGPAAALVGGVLFAVHPVHVEAVASVVGRAEVMATAFTLLAVFAAVERHSVVWSTVCWLLGLLSKENAVMAPALVSAAWLLGVGRPAPRRVAAFAGAWAVAGIGYALLRENVLHPYPPFVAPVFVEQPPSTIRLTAIASLRDVTRLLLVPIKLRADYSPAERTAVASVFDGRCIAGVVSLAAWVVWFVLARRRGRPVEALGLAWLGLAFAPVANLFFPIGVLLAERTLYLPSAGFAMAAGALAAPLRGRRLALLVSAVALLGGARTAFRVPVWRDEDSVIRSIVRDSPHSYVGFMLSASLFLMQGQDDKALQAAQVAIRIVPFDPRSYVVAAHAALKVGDTALATDLLDHADRICDSCLHDYQLEADFARRLGDAAVADTLLAHAQRAHQR